MPIVDRRYNIMLLKDKKEAENPKKENEFTLEDMVKKRKKTPDFVAPKPPSKK